MNETKDANPESDGHWRHGERQTSVPDTSMLPGSDLPPPAAVGLLKTAVRGAHDTIDRMADRAEPAVRQLGASVAAAEDALQAKAIQLRQTRDAWVEDLRCTVRSKPLAAIAVAAVLGALLARISR